ncbi:MAG TPA: serine/threonine-protein kinase [Actinomycetota bacterium]|nr:serine/threonine-protein kinase [Actinomycetota bacterium]
MRGDGGWGYKGTGMAGLEIGSTLGGYRIEGVIGRGGMGVVYLAEHLRLQVRHALKVVAPEHAGDEQFVERFLREARLAASLEHPNIIPIYGADEVDGIPFIAMRYVRGSNLGDLIDREGALDPDRALAILDQVGSALDAAHAQGLVHRDVKPANILIGEPSSPGLIGQVFLTDFGLTKRADSTSKLTKTGFYLGTLQYCAPEQLRAEPLDGRTDEYALAAVLFECLTGTPPFEREMEAQVVAAHLADEPPSASARRPQLHVQVDAVIARGMAKSKEDRYPTCAALMAAAREALAHGPAAGVPPAPPPPPTSVGRASAKAPPGDGPPKPPPGGLLPADEARRRTRRVGVLRILIPIIVVAGLIGATLTVMNGRKNGAAGPTTVPPPTGQVSASPPGPGPSGTPSGTTGATSHPTSGPQSSPSPPPTNPPPSPVNEVVGTVDIPKDPIAASFGQGSVWMTCLGDNFHGVVARINPGTNRVVKQIDVGGVLSGGAFGDGFLWIVDGDGTAKRIDPLLNLVTATVKVGGGPLGIAVGGGAVWVAEAGKVIRIDESTNKVAARIHVPGILDGIAFGAGSLWVSDDQGGTVSRIDPATNTVEAAIHVGGRPDTVVFAEGAVWVARIDNGTVVRIDPATNGVVTTIKVGLQPYGGTGGAGSIWIVNQKSDSVSRIDPATNEVTATIDVGDLPFAATFGDGEVWVANGGQANVSRIQP